MPRGRILPVLFWECTRAAAVEVGSHAGAARGRPRSSGPGCSRSRRPPRVFACPSFSVTRLHGQGFAAERVGEQSLQGFHLAPPARLYCLHDTRLEPTHHRGRPCASQMACQSIACVGEPHQQDKLPSSALPPVVGWPNSLVMRDPMEVCPLSRGVMSLRRATPIRPITGRPSLSPSSSTRRPIGAPCGCLPEREDDGLTTFHREQHGGVRSALSAGGVECP